MLPATSTRVSEHTSLHSNEQIDREIQRNVVTYSKGGKASIDHRLAELENEWDMERALQTNSRCHNDRYRVDGPRGSALAGFFRRGSRFHGSALVTGVVPARCRSFEGRDFELRTRSMLNGMR